MDIAAFARGYNQLLQAGNMGAGLRQASDVLAPVLNVRDLIGANRRRFDSATGTLPSGGDLQILGVPAGSIYFLHWVGVNLIADATGALFGAFIGYRPSGGLATNAMPLTNGVGLLSNQRAAISTGPCGLVLCPGDIITIRGNSWASAVTYEWGVSYDIYEGD